VTTTDPAHLPPPVGRPVAVETAPAPRAALRSPAAVRAERRAWLVLCLAFLTFCALVFSVAKFVLDYVSTAQVDQAASVTARRGLVFVVSPGSPDQLLLGDRSELGVGTVVTLDRSTTSAAELQLFDGSSVKLQSGSSLELTRMEIGRFIKQQAALLTQTAGAVRYATLGPIAVDVPNGTVQLAPHSDVTIWLDGDMTQVLVYGGEARLFGANPTPVIIGDRERGTLDAQRLAGGPYERTIVLLSNGNFAQHDDGWQAHDKVSGEQDTSGIRQWVSGPDDLLGSPTTALQIKRDSVKQQHGETGLSHKLDVDVSGFRHLWLRAWVRVDYADLSGGGQLGSEYPMMLQVQMEGPAIGSRPDWSIGFYYANPDRLPVPEKTAEQVPRGEWQPFAVDLMSSEASSQPYRLLGLTVLGQGHSFDARVANIELVGD